METSRILPLTEPDFDAIITAAGGKPAHLNIDRRDRQGADYRLFVRPFNGCCIAIVGADVAHNFAIEIFDRTEDAASDEVSLDFGEPDFDLIEPGGVSGRVMKTHFGVTSQKITDRLGLMGAQVITDDMDGLLLGLASDEIFQKRDKLCARV